VFGIGIGNGSSDSVAVWWVVTERDNLSKRIGLATVHEASIGSAKDGVAQGNGNPTGTV
jgi:hypothetical protein